MIFYYYLGFCLRRFRSKKALIQYQQKCWRRHWMYLRKYSPFYRSLPSLSGHILPPQLPKMNKAQMMFHFDRLNTRSVKKAHALQIALTAEKDRDFSQGLASDLSVGLSSGTSGNRGIFMVSLRERAIWVAAILHRVIGWSWRRRKVAFFLRADNKLYQSVQSRLLDFSYFDLLLPFAQLKQEVQCYQPHILVAPPSVLHQLAKAQNLGEISIHPTKIISVAEVLEPEIQDVIATVFRISVQQVYQCTEGFLAYTCVHGSLHFNEDLIMIQPHWLDACQTICHPVISDFTRRVQPIVNYELNDLVHISDEPCKCGSPFMRISRIEGRADDLLVFARPGGDLVYVLPDEMRRLMLLHVPDELDYQLEQLAVSRMVWRIGAKAEANLSHTLALSLKQWCDAKNLLVPELIFEYNWQIEPGRKFRRVIGMGTNIPQELPIA